MRRQQVTPKLISLLYMALEEELGLIVEVDEGDMNRFRTRLYREREKDPMFSVLSLTPSPDFPQTQLFILKTKKVPGYGEEV